MMRSLKLLAFAVMFIMGETQVTFAAEILCIQQWAVDDGPWNKFRNPAPRAPLSAEAASKAWPSGFRPSTNSCNAALIRGPIERGDYERYRAFYSHHHRALQLLFLASQGGNVEEAMKIGRLVRRYLITVWAPDQHGLINPQASSYLCQGPSCICASACALIWFGGVSRRGRVGLHRPRINDPEFKALPAADASTVYRRALQEISRYLEEMEAPRPSIDTMIATSSAEIQWVEEVGDSPLESPPSFSEWLDANCGSLTSQENQTFRELLGRRVVLHQQQNATEVMLWKMLSEKWERNRDCRLDLIRAKRDALAAP